jgi:hypothetical protein
MGMGKGEYSFNPQDLKSLEQKAKEKLTQSQSESKKNIFISFVEEDINEINLFRGQSKNENIDLEFSDHSVKEPYDSKDSEYIRGKIREKIQRASVTVVYISEDISKSRWVKWEVEESIKMGKKIIAIHKGDKPPTNIPAFISENKIKIVKWSDLPSNFDNL